MCCPPQWNVVTGSRVHPYRDLEGKSGMIRRLYAHNFKCFENFELTVKGMPSALLVGKNGSGKSTIASVLEIFQSVGRGTNRLGTLVKPADFTGGRSNVPIRLEIEVGLQGRVFKYVLAVEFPERFREARIAEEQLVVAGDPIFTRKEAEVTLHSGAQNSAIRFSVDWHLAALPVIQEQSETGPLRIFKDWLARIIILAPIPSLMTGDSRGETLEPTRDGSNFGDWLAGLLGRYPAAYTKIEQYLRGMMPDIRDFLNEPIGRDTKSTIIRFQEDSRQLKVYFSELSDGEKCLFLSSVVLAANEFYGPLFCFWDEPDNHLSLAEVGHFLISLRRSFENGGQLLATSHNPEAIRKFSDENTFMLDRKSHVEPTVVRLMSDLSFAGDLVDALIRDDVQA
jgi:ABC-type Mn2+/Zn2+ transport system ATPase subunit